MRRNVLTLVPLLVLSALVAPAKIAIAESESPFPEYEAIVGAYLRDYPGISPERARTAVLTQGGRVRMLEELGNTGADDFGASWYDPRTNTQHVLVTSDAMEAKVRGLAAKHGVGVEVGRAKYRLRDLNALAQRINAGLTPEVVKERSVVAVADSSTNRVTVITQNRSRADEARARFAHDPRVVVAQSSGNVMPNACVSRTACGSPFRAGISVGRDWDAGGPQQSEVYCSAGFTARSADGARWMITAGHCTGGWEDAGVSSSCATASVGGCWGHGGQWWGPIRDSWPHGVPPFPNVDVARARKDNSYWGAGGYIYNPGVPTSPYDVDLAIEFRHTIQVGNTVCQAARLAVTGAYCGTVKAVAAPEAYGMVRATPAGCPGDSGGGWYMYTGGQRWAVGIHHGSTEGCHVANGYSYFSTVPDIVAYWDSNTNSPIRFETR